MAHTKTGKPCVKCGGTERRASTNACVACHRQSMRAWRQDPENARINRDRKYGLGPGERDAMLERQGGRCAICGSDSPAGNGTWHLDHDHRFEPGDRRGHRALLCAHCNRGLGHFFDNPQHLASAAAYLTRHEAGLAA